MPGAESASTTPSAPAGASVQKYGGPASTHELKYGTYGTVRHKLQSLNRCHFVVLKSIEDRISIHLIDSSGTRKLFHVYSVNAGSISA